MAATRTDVPAGQDHLYFSAKEMAWEPAAAPPGDLKRLFTDPGDQMETRLVRYRAGDETGGEPDLLGREVMVLDGDFEANGVRLRRDDFHRASGATVTGRTESGCVLFTIREVARDAGTGEAPDVGTLDEAVTIRASDESWADLGNGTRVKLLTKDSVHRCEVSIVRMDAGATFPSHRHPGAEELLVLEGGCTCQGRHLGPGDYTRSAAGTQHEENRSEQGAEIIMVRHGVG